MARRSMTQTAAAAEKIPALYDMTAEETADFLPMTADERIEFIRMMQENKAFADLVNVAKTATSEQIKIVAAILQECKQQRGAE